jgi:hypothetical protein
MSNKPFLDLYRNLMRVYTFSNRAVAVSISLGQVLRSGGRKDLALASLLPIS